MSDGCSVSIVVGSDRLKEIHVLMFAIFGLKQVDQFVG